MRMLGLDVGERRIGVAVSDPLGITAQPYQVVEREAGDSDAALDEIVRLVAGLGAVRVVVGLPLDQAGEVGRQARATLAFSAALEERIQVPVVAWDERYSTAAAERALLSGGVRRAKRRQVRDKVAAAFILQGYLDAGSPEEPA